MATLARLQQVVDAVRIGAPGMKRYVGIEQCRAVVADAGAALGDVLFDVLVELDATQRRLADANAQIESKQAALSQALIDKHLLGQQVRDLGRALSTMEARLRIAQEQQR